MLQKALQYLVGLKANQTYEIDGRTWSDNRLNLVEVKKNYPAHITCGGLDSIVALVMSELDRLEPMTLPVYIRVDSPTTVNVFTSWDEFYVRSPLYVAETKPCGLRDGYRDFDTAIIELRSKVAPGEGVDYLLDLLSRINQENVVSITDNGITQTVEARSGIALKQMENIRPRVPLRPFRTFLEVEQPQSDYLVRINKEGQIGFFSADGGVWEMTARETIAKYFEVLLEEQISEDKVVVMI